MVLHLHNRTSLGVVGVSLGVVGVSLGVYALILSRRQGRDIKTILDFLFKEFGKKFKVQGHFEAKMPEMTASVGVRRKKQPIALWTLLRRLYLKGKDRYMAFFVN